MQRPKIIQAALLVLAAAAVPAAALAARAPAGPAPNPGRELFVMKGCYQCHGYAGQGARNSGVAIASPAFPLAVMQAYVRHPTGQMPPYTQAILSDAELSQIHDYLASIPANRPASEIPLLGGTAPPPKRK
jgi:ubiquinol-cytochrome c reductase cytochrome c subunit